MFASRNRVISYRHRVLTCALALAVGVLATAVHAQKYQTIPVKLDSREMNRLRMVFVTASRNPAGFGASQQDIENYFKSGFFPMMASDSPEALSDLADSREDLITKYIPQTANAGAQQYLIDLTYNVAKVLVRGNYHPAVRYNAALMLGELDQQLASGGNPPVPHAKATQELIELLENDSFKNVPVPESVKLGAVLGLERHARFGIEPQLNDRLTKALIAIMASETPEDVDSDVHDWVRSSAAKALANQFAKAPAKEAQDALTALIANQKVSLDDRCATAGSLNRITYAPGTDIDGNAATVALAQLTLDVITDAAKLARDYQKEALGTADFSSMGNTRRGGGGYGRGGGEYGGEFGGGRGGYGGRNDEEVGPKFERRQLFDRLFNIGVGGGSLKAGLADEAKGHLEELTTALGPVLRIMEDKNAGEVDVTQEVIKLEAEMKPMTESWVKPVAAEDKPAETAAADKPAEAIAGNE